MSDRKITVFYLNGCPYCRQARRALEELVSGDERYSALSLEWVEENEHPEISAKYDYYYVPTFFVDGVKEYEARRGESYEECRENVRRVLEGALS